MLVREKAVEAGLTTAAKKDSTGICFIGERNFKEFLGQYLPAQPGDMKTMEGEAVGRHDGLMYYTIGQRHGLGIGGAGDPWFVIRQRFEKQMFFLSVKTSITMHYYSDSLTAIDVSFSTVRELPNNIQLYSEIPLSSA